MNILCVQILLYLGLKLTRINPSGFYEFPPQEGIEEWDSHTICIMLCLTCWGKGRKASVGAGEFNHLDVLLKVSPSYSPEGLFKHRLLTPTTRVPHHFLIQEWGLHICSSNKFLGDATATNQLGEPHLEKYSSIFPSS